VFDGRTEARFSFSHFSPAFSISEAWFGEALDPDRLERLGRYEVHLDRNLERTLAILIRLQDLRRIAHPADPFRKLLSGPAVTGGTI
jgi:hypothetical protein